MKSDRFTEPEEIKRDFPECEINNMLGGPIIYNEGRRMYVDTGESHILVDGRTGMGKSLCVSTSFAISCLMSGESLIAIDPKGDLYERTAHIAEKSHKCIVIDLRSPHDSIDGWDPLKYIYKCYKSSDPVEVDLADTMLTALSESIFDVNSEEDPFWPETARTLFSGMVRGLFEVADESEINLNSIANMVEISEELVLGSTLVKHFADLFETTSIVRRQLSSYTNAPRDTRGSIHSFAANGLSIFGRNNGLIKLLGNDTIDIANLDVDRKSLAIYIIIPDEVGIYNSLAAILINQLTTHLIGLAHKKYHGRLPSRVNIILEEVSSIGKAIPNLNHLLTASRSRNIRLMLVTQNAKSQLEEIYGKSKAESIYSCIGVTYAFSNNSFDAMTAYSQRCGYKIDDTSGITKDILISPTQLSAMRLFTALVIIENRYRYIFRLAPYYELFDARTSYDAVPRKTNIPESPNKVFDFKKYVETMANENFNKRVQLMMEPVTPPALDKELPFDDYNPKPEESNAEEKKNSAIIDRILQICDSHLEEEVNDVESGADDQTDCHSELRGQFYDWVEDHVKRLPRRKDPDRASEKLAQQIKDKYMALPGIEKRLLVFDIDIAICRNGYETHGFMPHKLVLNKSENQSYYQYINQVAEFFELSKTMASIKCVCEPFSLTFENETSALHTQKVLRKFSIESEYIHDEQVD